MADAQDRMNQQDTNFKQALGRLEEIVEEVRRKDTDLDRSLELLEEGIQLANVCTEKIDHTRMLADEANGAFEQEVAAGDAELS